MRVLKRRFLSWIDRQLAAARNDLATARFDPTATLGPEGVVENTCGEPDRISVGAHSYVRGRLFTYGHGGRIVIGDWCYVGVRSEIWSMDSISIGNRVLIAHDVNIHDGTAHSLASEERHAHFRHIVEQGHPRTAGDVPGIQSAPVVIEDDVWISFGVMILKGVRIGAGSVIAAGALVTDSVPPGTFYRCEVRSVMTPVADLLK